MLVWGKRILFACMVMGIAVLALYAQEPGVVTPIPSQAGPWPESAEGWLVLVGELLAIIMVVGGFLAAWLNRKIAAANAITEANLATAIKDVAQNLKSAVEDLTHQINEVGRKVNVQETLCSNHYSSHDEAIGDLKRAAELSVMDRGSMREAIGRLEGLIERVAQENAKRDEKLASAIQEMAVNIGKMQTEMLLFREAKDDIIALLRHARTGG